MRFLSPSLIAKGVLAGVLAVGLIASPSLASPPGAAAKAAAKAGAAKTAAGTTWSGITPAPLHAVGRQRSLRRMRSLTTRVRSCPARRPTSPTG